MAKDRVRLFGKMDVEAVLTDVRYVAAGPVGFTLFWKGVAHSKLNLADGFVPRDAPALLCPGVPPKEIEKGVRALLACGLWTPVEGGYATPEGWWEAEQVTAEQVGAKRQKDADRKAAERERRRAEKERLAAMDSARSHAGVTRDIGCDSEGSHGGVTALSREGTEHRAQSTEHILPSGSSADAAALVPLKPGWGPLGDWLDDPLVRDGLARIEANRSPGIPPVQPEQTAILVEVLRTNAVPREGFVGVLESESGRRWRKLDPEGVLRVWREEVLPGLEPKIPAVIPVADEAERESLLRAEMARMGR